MQKQDVGEERRSQSDTRVFAFLNFDNAGWLYLTPDGVQPFVETLRYGGAKPTSNRAAKAEADQQVSFTKSPGS